MSYCRPCKRIASRQWRLLNPDKVKEQAVNSRNRRKNKCACGNQKNIEADICISCRRPLTPEESKAKRRERQRGYQKARYLKHRDEIALRAKEWRKQNRAKEAIRHKKERERDLDVYRERERLSRHRRKDKSNEYWRHQIATLGDSYVRSLIRENLRRVGLEADIITNNMVEAKRESVIAMRALKKLKEAGND